jgi:hypothetical protein
MDSNERSAQVAAAAERVKILIARFDVLYSELQIVRKDLQVLAQQLERRPNARDKPEIA